MRRSGVFDGVLDDLLGGGFSEIDPADVGQPDEIQEHVGELLPKVLLLRLLPVGQPSRHLPPPLEDLRELAHLAHLQGEGKQEVHPTAPTKCLRRCVKRFS